MNPDFYATFSVKIKNKNKKEKEFQSIKKKSEKAFVLWKTYHRYPFTIKHIQVAKGNNIKPGIK